MRSTIQLALSKTKAGGLALIAAAALAGCGGGDGGTAATATATITGKFVDAAVLGLGYKCGAATTLSGTTNASGQFTCNAGESVAFYVGGIKLGSVATAQALVTPLDLVGVGAAPTDAKVINIVRFLMSISSTPAASGTLTIDAAVVTAAANLAIDFTQGAPANLDAVIAAVKPAGATAATAQQATDHMQSSVFGLFAGQFSGTFAGVDSGSWSLSINNQGVVNGTATSSSEGSFDVTGSMATTLGTGSTYVFTGSAGDVPWVGTLNLLTGQFSGTWNGGGAEGGTFTGQAAVQAPAASAGGGTLIVSGITPAAGNGNFSLPIALETAAGGTSTLKRVEFTDANPATRTLRLYYDPATGALQNVQYNSPAGNLGCMVGDVVAPCDSAKITFSAVTKSILLNGAAFTVNGNLEGHFTW